MEKNFKIMMLLTLLTPLCGFLITIYAVILSKTVLGYKPNFFEFLTLSIVISVFLTQIFNQYVCLEINRGKM